MKDSQGNLFYCHVCTVKYQQSKNKVMVAASTPPTTTKLNWEFGSEPRPSVEAAVAAAIAKNSVRAETKVSPVKTAPQAKPGNSVRTENKTSVAPGPLHYHKCASCGFIWGHTDASYGNREDHMCPKCGYGPNWRVYSREGP